MPARGRKIIVDKNEKKKKDTILIAIKKDDDIGKYFNDFEVLKIVKRYGKYYAMVKNK